MTNAEKYQEVFGLIVDHSMCPTTDCDVCPCVSKDSKGNVSCVGGCTYKWWDEEYKGTHAVKIEITEHHTFAKPDDVEDLDFPGVSSEDK